MSEPLIHALVFETEGQPRALTWEEVETAGGRDGRIWVHLDAQSESCSEWLKGAAGVPATVRRTLLAEETRPRTSVIGDGLLVVLRGVNLNPGADPEDMVSIRLWLERDRVISTQRRRLLSVSDTVKSLKTQSPTGSADLLLRLISRLEDRISDVVDDLESRISDLEEAVMTEPTPAMRMRLAELRRECIGLRRYLAPQRDALIRLQAEPVAWFSDTDRMNLREVNDRMMRLVEDIDAIRERAALVSDELLSRLSDQLNQRMYLLSIVAALFLPLSFLTGLLGINVGGIPGSESPYGFWIFSGLLTLILAGQIWLFVGRKWFK